MDSLFGIGLPELFLIAVIALIVLGPQRLPGTIREIAKFIRQVRNLTNEFTSQFGDDFKALDDLNPRKIIINMIAEEDEKEAKAKEVATKPSPAKPTLPASTTTANKVASNTAKALAAANATTPAMPTAEANNAISSVATTSPQKTTATDLVTDSTVIAEKVDTVDTKVEAVKVEAIIVAEARAVAGDENRIMPPTSKAAAEPAQLNGHTETPSAFLEDGASTAEPMAQAVPETKVEAMESVQ